MTGHPQEMRWRYLTGSGEVHARFSPDGPSVAFHTANSPNPRRVYAAPVSLRTPIPSRAWVPIVTGHGCYPNWSADGLLLYLYTTSLETTGDIWMLDKKGK